MWENYEFQTNGTKETGSDRLSISPFCKRHRSCGMNWFVKMKLDGNIKWETKGMVFCMDWNYHSFSSNVADRIIPNHTYRFCFDRRGTDRLSKHLRQILESYVINRTPIRKYSAFQGKKNTEKRKSHNRRSSRTQSHRCYINRRVTGQRSKQL